MYKHFFKRFFDFWIALIALICLSPLLLVVTIWLHFANKGSKNDNHDANDNCKGNWLQRWFEPVIFTQERPGKDAQIFKVIKFKSMTDERDAEGNLLPDADRLTRVGKFVRNTSIDELPQLINVLKGDMALIGPRPLLVQYLPLYNEEQHRRHEVRPGISGWAQVHGRNLLLMSKKFEYDVWYVDHLTLGLDIKIIWMTIMNVLRRSDIGEGAGNMIEVDDLRFAERIKLN
jgi:lipopolysaccharide/colanic/teichoic acid biosynthesis glycosyltransferase